MLRFKLLLFILVMAQAGFGQNLIPNGSFEAHTQKPDSLGQWAYCEDWYSTKKRNPDNNPDYYHKGGTGEAKAGFTPYAYCDPDVDGEAMMGLTTIDFRIGGLLRDPRQEYIYCKLKEPLIPGATYEASFWVSPGDDGIQAEVVDHGFGMEFMLQKPVQNGFSEFRTEYSYPQVSHAYLGTATQERDIGEWRQIRVSYTASAAFQYAVIGGFGSLTSDNCTDHCYDYNFVDEVSVVLVKGPDVEITGTDTICKGDSITLKGLNTHKYEWAELSDSANIISQASAVTMAPERSTAYILYGSFGVDTHYVEVIDVKDTFDLFTDTTICFDEAGILLGNAPVARARYVWSPSGETTSSIAVQFPGTYQLEVAYKGCQLISGTVKVIDLNAGLNLPDSLYLCEDSFVVIKNRNILDPDLTRSWSPSGSSGETLKVDRSGSYSLTLSQGQCSASDTTQVIQAPSLSVQLGDDYTLCEKNNETVKLNAGKGFDSYKWFPTGDSSHFITVQKVDTYFVVVADGYGCKAGDGAIIRSKCPYPMTLFFPNSFSPNGDLVNDEFVIKGEQVQNFTFKVFNRWGQCLYTSIQQSDSWDGTFQGAICQDDTYYYTCSVMGPDEKSKNRMRTFSGYIHLIK